MLKEAGIDADTVRLIEAKLTLMVPSGRSSSGGALKRYLKICVGMMAAGWAQNTTPESSIEPCR